VDQRLTIGFFLFGCLIVLATVLGFNRIQRLEDVIIEQDKTIKIQNEAIMMQRVENSMLKQMVYPRN
jgi:hypothetical protein